jgi:hypothetical protein
MKELMPLEKSSSSSLFNENNIWLNVFPFKLSRNNVANKCTFYSQLLKINVKN